MTWVTWRQHRTEAIVGLCLLAALAAYAILLGTSMRTAFTHDNLAACIARSQGAGCQNAIGDFDGKFGSAVNIAFWASLLLLPGLIGVVVGAPLLGRELEFGTWRLAWSQTVPRGRWLVIKLALVGGGLAVLGGAMSAIIMWYRAPMDRLVGHLVHNAYDFEGVVLPAYILAAFGLAVLAGLLLRRSIPAMIAALVAWLALRLGVEFGLRNQLLPSSTLSRPCTGGCSGSFGNIGISAIPPETGHIGDLVLSGHYARNRFLISYQPAGHFWGLQFAEAGLFLAVTLAALGAAVWVLHRRGA